MRQVTLLLFVTACALVPLSSIVAAQEESKALPSDNHIAELKQLEAWCPLDQKLTGLDIEYCNKDKVADADKGPLLQASEARAKKVLFGTKEKGQECGLCSSPLNKKGCSTTKSGVKISFDIAIKADNYRMLNKWCLLGKANMELCRNFGSESEGLVARTKMCADLKANKFALDPLRALEFGAGEDGPLSEIIGKLGQKKVYSLLGLGGCLTLLEEKPELIPVFKKIRPDAGAVICVRALADSTTPVLDIVADVYNGFIKKGEDIVARHKTEFVKTNIVKVLKKISGMVQSLKKRQLNFTTVERVEDEKVGNKTVELKKLNEVEAKERLALENYTKIAADYRRRYREFQRVRGARVVTPQKSSDTQGQELYMKEEIETGLHAQNKPKPDKTVSLNSTKIVKKIEREDAGLSPTAKRIVDEAIKKHELETQKLLDEVKEESKKKVLAAQAKVDEVVQSFRDETAKVRSAAGMIEDSKLKSQ